MYRIHRAVHWASLDAYIRSLAPAAWFRMDQGVTVTGAGISQVDDLSGNARHLLDPGTTRPIYLPYSGTRYLYLPGVAGNYASTPDSVANSITGDIDIRVRVALDDWTPAAVAAIAAKWNTGAFSYLLRVNTNGALLFNWSANGTASAGTITSTIAVSFSDAQPGWIRIAFDVDDGGGNNVCRFYTAADSTTQPTSWTQLGSTVTTAGATSIADTAAIVEVGASTGGTANPVSGKIYRAIIKDGIDGTTVVDFNPADADGDGDTSFASSTTGETWTINSTGSLPAQIVGRASALFNGTSHYLKCNAFTLNQPTCVIVVLKQVSWTSGEFICDGNAINTCVIYQSATTPRIRMFAGATTTENPNLAVGAVGVVAGVFNGASSSLQVNKTTATGGNPGAANAGGFTIGARADGVAFVNIQVYETVIFPIAPSTAQLDRLIAGLMARHGVA